MVQIFVNSGRVALIQIEEEKIDDYGHQSYDMKKNESIEDEGIDDGSDAKRIRREEHYSEDKWDRNSPHSASLYTSGNPDDESMLVEKPAHIAGKESTESLKDYVTVDFTNEEDGNFTTGISAGDDGQGSLLYSSNRSSSTVHNDYVTSSSSSLQSDGFTRTSVANLRELAAELHIDISDCIEKKEMTDRILAAVNRQRT